MIPLRIVDSFPLYELREPGMMWRFPDGDTEDRECWWIILPTHPDIGTPGHPGQLSWRTTQISSDGKTWDVSGTAPLLTVTPSIDVVRFVRDPSVTDRVAHVREGSYWHGFITDGFLVG